MTIINRYSETKVPKKQKLDGTISDNQEPTVFEDPEKQLEQSRTAEPVTENLELHHIDNRLAAARLPMAA